MRPLPEGADEILATMPPADPLWALLMLAVVVTEMLLLGWGLYRLARPRELQPQMHTDQHR